LETLRAGIDKNPKAMSMRVLLTRFYIQSNKIYDAAVIFRKMRTGAQSGRIEKGRSAPGHATPKIERRYRELTSKQFNLKAKRDYLMQKYMTAKVAHGLEKEQKGERFRIAGR
jgi:hypothetical protein